MKRKTRADERLLGRLARLGLALAMLLGYLGIQVASGSTAYATTNQFHGVNWADPNDNFITGPNVPVGLSTSDDYATTYTKSTAILKGFQALGANTVRMGMNAATTSGSWWSSYTAALDAATALGMNVIIAPWLQNGTAGDTTSFYQMWDTVIGKYGTYGNFYFDIMNEPNGYNATDLTNFEAGWLAHYPNLPRGHVMVPGLGNDQNLCAVGADSRLAGTLLSIHIYGMFGDSHTTEADWITDFDNELCGYASRAVLTEFGVPMTTGVNYDGPRDGTNDLSYLYGITDTVRSLGMGSVLWTGVKLASQVQGPGGCENASCAITTLNGSGTNLSLSLNNQSGLDRLQYGWGISSNGGGAASELHAVGAGKCADVLNQSTTPGAQVQIWDCGGAANQLWTHTSSNQLTVYSGSSQLCLDAYGGGTGPGTKVDVWTCNGLSNQQWNINSNGTITGIQSGLCLDVAGASTANGTPLQLWTCNGGTNQQWGTATAGELHAVGAGKCADVLNQSTTPGAQVQIWDCGGAPNQVWTHTLSNQLTVYSGSSQLCLDAYGGGTGAGTRVDVWTCNGLSNQQWNINANGTITGVQSGLCLDVSGASTANGAPLQLWTCNGGTNQQWSTP